MLCFHTIITSSYFFHTKELSPDGFKYYLLYITLIQGNIYIYIYIFQLCSDVCEDNSITRILKSLNRFFYYYHTHGTLLALLWLNSAKPFVWWHKSSKWMSPELTSAVHTCVHIWNFPESRNESHLPCLPGAHIGCLTPNRKQSEKVIHSEGSVWEWSFSYVHKFTILQD